MLKRLVAAASVTIIAGVGIAPAASAASSEGRHHQYKPKVVKIIDWDAPTPAPGFSTQRIDWD